MAMQLGRNGREHARNMNQVIALPDGTTTTMKQIEDMIKIGAGDNAPYATKFAEDAYFDGDAAKLAQLIEALKS